MIQNVKNLIALLGCIAISIFFFSINFFLGLGVVLFLTSYTLDSFEKSKLLKEKSEFYKTQKDLLDKYGKQK